jgi:hypothetical protein
MVSACSLAWLLACRGAAVDGEEVKRREAFIQSYVTAQDGGPVYDLVLNEEVRFGYGFCFAETPRVKDTYVGAFRRMAHHGVVELRTHGAAPMQLQFAGQFDKHPFHAKTAITLAIQGELVDSFLVEDDAPFEHTTVVTSEHLANRSSVDLGISLSNWSDGPYDTDCSQSRFWIKDLTWTPK